MSNPYQEVGELHNAGLDYVINNLEKDQPVTIHRIIELVSKYLQSVKDDDSDYSKAVYYKLVSNTVNRLNIVPMEELFRETRNCRESICYLNEIQKISEDFDYPTTLKILKNIEMNILSSDMTEEERQYPLLNVGVAIASVKYWIAQIADAKSPWIPFTGPPAAFKWPWRSDANGAIAGGIGGAVGGSLGGPGGILVGGILGAIGGAIGASVADALIRT